MGLKWKPIASFKLFFIKMSNALFLSVADLGEVSWLTNVEFNLYLKEYHRNHITNKQFYFTGYMFNMTSLHMQHTIYDTTY